MRCEAWLWYRDERI